MADDRVRVVQDIVILKDVGRDLLGKVLTFPPDHELVPVGSPDLERHNLLFVLAAQDAPQPAPAGRVLVLGIRLMVGQIVIHRITAFLPLLLGLGVDPHPGVDGLAARVDEQADGQVRLLEDGHLLVLRLLVELD